MDDSIFNQIGFIAAFVLCGPESGNFSDILILMLSGFTDHSLNCRIQARPEPKVSTTDLSLVETETWCVPRQLPKASRDLH